MMTLPRPTPATLALAAVAAICLAFVAGRASAPAKVHETYVAATSSTKTDATFDFKAANQKIAEATATVADVRKDLQSRQRIVYLPGGKVIVTKWMERTDTSHNATTQKSAAASGMTESHAAAHAETKTEYVYRDRTVETSKAAWSVAARAGLGLDLRPRYGAEVGRRLLGPLWLTLDADVTSRAALVGLRMEF